MRTIVVIALLLLAGCSSPETQSGESEGAFTAQSFWSQANETANAMIANATLISVQGWDGADLQGNDEDEFVGDGYAPYWRFDYNGTDGGVSVVVDAKGAQGEANNGYFGANQTAIEDWNLDSDEALQLAVADGLLINVSSIQMSLVQDEEPWWIFLADSEFRLVNADDGDVRTSLQNSSITLPQTEPISGSGTIPAAQGGVVGMEFVVDVESKMLHVNYTRTSTSIYGLYNAILDHPDGNSTQRGHNVAQLGTFYEFIIEAPPIGTYYLNMTGALGNPAFDVGWCVYGYNPSADETIPC